MKTSKTKWLFLAVLISLGTLLILGFLAYELLAYLYLNDDTNSAYMTSAQWAQRNAPTAQLSDLDWSKGVYKIYYQDAQGLHSEMSDGSSDQLLYSSAPSDDTVYDYFLIKPSGKILLFTYLHEIVMNGDGTNPQVLYTQNGYGGFTQERVSPDNQWVVFARSPGDIHQQPDIHITNLLTEQTYQLSPSDALLNPSNAEQFLDSIYWLDNNQIIIRVTKYVPEPTLTQVIIYNLVTKKPKLIGQFTPSTVVDPEEDMKLSDYLTLSQLSQLIIPEKNSYDVYIHDSYLAFTSDMSKSVSLETNGEKGTLTLKNFTTKNGSPEHTVSEKVITSWDEISPYMTVASNPAWLPDDDHVVIKSLDGIRIVETSTGKVAFFSTGEDPKWEGKITPEDTIPTDWGQ